MTGITERANRTLIYRRYVGLDLDFHALIVEAANNNVLHELWQQTLAHIQVARVRYRRHDRRIMEPTTSQHQAILDAFRACDSEQAVTLMREHLHKARELLMVDFRNMCDSQVSASTS
jgi:DNA-binding GntR family transcriptional regulator